jgi:hypothetical protein
MAAAVYTATTDDIIGTLTNGKKLGLTTITAAGAGADAGTCVIAKPIKTIEFWWVGHRNPKEYGALFTLSGKTVTIDPVGSVDTGVYEIMWVGV